MAQIALHKYHSLRNDFLIFLNDEGRDVDEGLVRHMCDRVEGVGADGFVNVQATGDTDTPHSIDWWNSDGSHFEMSGNGIRCVACCVVDDERASEGNVFFQTPAGRRSVFVGPRASRTSRKATANMGSAEMAEVPAEVKDILGFGNDAAFVNVGNPHLVIRDDDRKINLLELGTLAQSAVIGGVNVELISVESSSKLDMRVFERGAGVTESCGTGATASAAAFYAWGVCGDTITVKQTGGDALLTYTEGEWFLGSPVIYVSSVNVDVAD